MYVTDTFKLNLDFCMEDVKSFLNTLSMSESVKSMVTMDMGNIDYPRMLACERQIRQQTGSLTFIKGYVQDVIIVGNNGYQYNYLHTIKGNITDTVWFGQYVDQDRKGFQYILPHKVDFYSSGIASSDEVLSIVLPIRGEKARLGYVICDMYFHGHYWMVTDPWEGLAVYVSDDAGNWRRCSNILDLPGKRPDDGAIGAHGDVLVHNGHAYIFYFTHPEVSKEERNDPDFVWEYRHRRTSLQVAELVYCVGELICDRDHVELELE